VTKTEWTCTAWGATVADLEEVLRRVGGRRHLRFEATDGHAIVLEAAHGRPVARARVGADFPIAAHEIAARLLGVCIVEASAPEHSEDHRRIEMVALGARAFLETEGERGTAILVGPSTRELRVGDASQLRHVRASLHATLTRRLGGSGLAELLGMDEAGSWVVAPGATWTSESELRFRDTQSHGDRLFAAALANAPPGLSEAAGWPPPGRSS